MSIHEPRSLPNFIGGHHAPPDDDEWIDDLRPATGEISARIARSKPVDVDDAVQSAKAAFEGPWGRSTTQERADLCDAIADAHRPPVSDELRRASSPSDTGQALRSRLAKRVDIPRAIANFRFFAGAIRHRRNGIPRHGWERSTTPCASPLGVVVGLITPWNLPLYLLSWKAAPGPGDAAMRSWPSRAS